MNNITRKCFVLMPFVKQLEEIYVEVYKPICDEIGFYCWRVDEILRPGSITKDIIQGIRDSDIIIADLTSNNPNVFYELGVAHTINKRTIMTCQQVEDIPFDVSTYRVIIYQHTLTGVKELAGKLKKAINETLESGDTYSNPVTDALSISPHLSVNQLSEILNFEKLTPSVRRYLRENNIKYPSDISEIDFDDMSRTKNIGKASIRELLTQLIDAGLVKETTYHSKLLHR